MDKELEAEIRAAIESAALLFLTKAFCSEVGCENIEVETHVKKTIKGKGYEFDLLIFVVPINELYDFELTIEKSLEEVSQYILKKGEAFSILSNDIQVSGYCVVLFLGNYERFPRIDESTIPSHTIVYFSKLHYEKNGEKEDYGIFKPILVGKNQKVSTEVLNVLEGAFTKLFNNSEVLSLPPLRKLIALYPLILSSEKLVNQRRILAILHVYIFNSMSQYYSKQGIRETLDLQEAEAKIVTDFVHRIYKQFMIRELQKYLSHHGMVESFVRSRFDNIEKVVRHIVKHAFSFVRKKRKGKRITLGPHFCDSLVENAPEIWSLPYQVDLEQFIK